MADAILFVGFLCLDDVLECDHYPTEDEDTQAAARQLYRGGNPANSSVILAQLIKANNGNTAVSLLTNFAHDGQAEFLRSDLTRHGVDFSHAQTIDNCHTPTSFIIRNTSSGSRTIVNYNDLPPLTLDAFTAVPLESYGWVHIEGRRNVETIEAMAAHARAFADEHGSLTLSTELEKPHKGLLDLVKYFDVVFFSKDFAHAHGYEKASTFLQGMKQHAREGAILICAWGSKGADAVDQNGAVLHCDAYTPGKVIDTLGAGDTFNAAVIHALSVGKSVASALHYANRVAGAKCGVIGMDTIGAVVSDNGIHL
eukprot:m.103223 g.103223  ORF g.103223 m.103223 type:complete len:311 (+) comp8846_c0_seq4:56-988(+)